jgi:hypothetical protein
LQTSLNLALGSALASIGLTIPAVAIVSLATGWKLTLGIDVKSTVLLILSLFVTGHLARNRPHHHPAGHRAAGDLRDVSLHDDRSVMRRLPSAPGTDNRRKGAEMTHAFRKGALRACGLRRDVRRVGAERPRIRRSR